MARGRPVILTTRSFSKKGDAIKYFGEMLNSYKPGDRVTDAHAADLASLLERHRIPTPRTAEFARARGRLLMYDAALGQAAC